jgi:hypothetical protein
MIKNKITFYDYLNILKKDFSDFKYIIFYWKSGSWKSTYIKKLKINNKTLKNFIVIDEIYDIFDFFRYLKLFKSKRQFLIASHIPNFLYFILKIFWKIEFYNINKCGKKICKYLDEKWFFYSTKAIEVYLFKFKANYTDLEIILENYSWNNFDEALSYFLKYNNLILDTKKAL